MNTDALWPTLIEAKVKVLGIQAKLHQWATDSPDRRFDDLFNLVADPAFLTVGWDRVRGNRGARSAGVDGVTPRSIGADELRFLTALREDVKARRFPLLVPISPDDPAADVNRRAWEVLETWTRPMAVRLQRWRSHHRRRRSGRPRARARHQGHAAHHDHRRRPLPPSGPRARVG